MDYEIFYGLYRSPYHGPYHGPHHGPYHGPKSQFYKVLLEREGSTVRSVKCVFLQKQRGKNLQLQKYVEMVVQAPDSKTAFNYTYCWA